MVALDAPGIRALQGLVAGAVALAGGEALDQLQLVGLLPLPEEAQGPVPVQLPALEGEVCLHDGLHPALDLRQVVRM